ncbi:MAG: hypothetical protein IJV39_03040 [Ruminococcus sp.]|nr:hypothetical protein [Ruminococcus sp.]
MLSRKLKPTKNNIQKEGLKNEENIIFGTCNGISRFHSDAKSPLIHLIKWAATLTPDLVRIIQEENL